ncbi:MAG: Gfo/Idh/MocA family protein, partial [Chloroflexota bacterium]
SPLLQDMAIHTFDAARYLCGADPVSVYCEHFNPPWSWYPGHACATALFDMTGGLKYTYRGCWTNQGFDTAWEAEWRAIGPHGTVLWDGLSAPRAEIGGEPGTFPIDIMRETEALDPAMATWLEGSLLAFIDGMDSGRAPMGECHDNLKSLAMVFGAVESAVTGQRIQISELLQGSSASPCHEM